MDRDQLDPATGPRATAAAPLLEEPSLPDLGHVWSGLRRQRRLVAGIFASALLHSAVLVLGAASRPASSPPAPPLQVRLLPEQKAPSPPGPGRTVLVGEQGSQGLPPTRRQQPAPPRAEPARPVPKASAAGPVAFEAVPAPPSMFSWWQFSDPDLGYFGPKDLDQPAAPEDADAFLQGLAVLDALPAGRVRVRVYINQNGEVDRVEILESDPPGAFDEAVLRELYRSRFTPALKDGRVVKSRKDLEIGVGERQVLFDSTASGAVGGPEPAAPEPRTLE